MFRQLSVSLGALLLCVASATAQSSEFRFDRRTSGYGAPASMSWLEYKVDEHGNRALVGLWLFDPGVRKPEHRWFFTNLPLPSTPEVNAAHARSAVSKEFMRRAPSAALAEMRLSGRDRYALTLTILHADCEDVDASPTIE